MKLFGELSLKKPKSNFFSNFPNKLAFLDSKKSQKATKTANVIITFKHETNISQIDLFLMRRVDKGICKDYKEIVGEPHNTKYVNNSRCMY